DPAGDRQRCAAPPHGTERGAGVQRHGYPKICFISTSACLTESSALVPWTARANMLTTMYLDRDSWTLGPGGPAYPSARAIFPAVRNGASGLGSASHILLCSRRSPGPTEYPLLVSNQGSYCLGS